METHAFRAMGTTIEVFVQGEAAARWQLVECEFERLERSMSRFQADSELARLNRDGRIVASRALSEVVELALEARERTGGLFDPTVHDAVVGAGYDRTFEELPADPAPVRGGASCGGEVLVDGRKIRLAPGVRLDLGGIAKGYAADRACALLADAGPSLVNAGGDLAIDGGRWPVGIETATDTMTVLLGDGGVATSGQDRRRWGGGARHHLIDPRTGAPARTDVLRATVVASSAVEAEVLAKAAFLGADVSAPRVLVTTDGRTIVAGGIA
jgi:thiamine biosynthesis lipoprotein